MNDIEHTTVYGEESNAIDNDKYNIEGDNVNIKVDELDLMMVPNEDDVDC